ncbi:MAG TPA: YceI family protein, partial [Chitinophagales bacterium]|nr:YceI family protein [Chitinophagales bacterium]
KGMLDIHGVKQERIIKCTVRVTPNRIAIASDFTVLLEDHKINIPRIVNEKIFPEIKINVNLTLQPK